ncbi:HAD hydrolase-like protein [Streptomyces albidoflavus]
MSGSSSSPPNGKDLAAGGWTIGDSHEHDVEGGRATGLRTVRIGRQQAWPRDEPQADRTVPDALAAISLLLDGSAWTCRPRSRLRRPPD